MASPVPSINPTITGWGHAQIDGGNDAARTEIAPKVTTIGLGVDRAGQVGHQRLFHAGWVGIGYYGGGGGAPDLITWSTYIRLEYEDFRITNGVTFGTDYFWELEANTVVDLEIDW